MTVTVRVRVREWVRVRVRVRVTSVGHREDARPRVAHVEVLVLELAAVDALTAGAVHVGEVAALHHEAFDHAVEDAVLVVQRLARDTSGAPLPGAQAAEVLHERRVGGRCGRQAHARRAGLGGLTSAVLGTMSAKSSITIRPAFLMPIWMSRKTRGLW